MLVLWARVPGSWCDGRRSPRGLPPWPACDPGALPSGAETVLGVDCVLDHRANIRSLPEYRYTLAEYEPTRPWVLVGALRRLSVELDDDEDFVVWAARAWPRPRYQVDRLPDLPPWEGAG